MRDFRDRANRGRLAFCSEFTEGFICGSLLGAVVLLGFIVATGGL